MQKPTTSCTMNVLEFRRNSHPAKSCQQEDPMGVRISSVTFRWYSLRCEGSAGSSRTTNDTLILSSEAGTHSRRRHDGSRTQVHRVHEFRRKTSARKRRARTPALTPAGCWIASAAPRLTDSTNVNLRALRLWPKALLPPCTSKNEHCRRRKQMDRHHSECTSGRKRGPPTIHSAHKVSNAGVLMTCCGALADRTSDRKSLELTAELKNDLCCSAFSRL